MSSLDAVLVSCFIILAKEVHLESVDIGRHVDGVTIDEIPALQMHTSLALEESRTHDSYETCFPTGEMSDSILHTVVIPLMLKSIADWLHYEQMMTSPRLQPPTLQA